MEFWWLVTFWVDGVGLGQAPPALLGKHQFVRINRNLSGQLIDLTNNHGADRRIWSPALNQKRSMYVYLPPNFDPNKRYPMAFFLHGAAQDEQFFLQAQVESFDKAMASGTMPPSIIVAPDGSVHGRATLLDPAWWLLGHRHYSAFQLKRFARQASFETEEVQIHGGFWTVFSVINMYIAKWCFRQPMFFAADFVRNENSEYVDSNNGFANIFIKFRKIDYKV